MFETPGGLLCSSTQPHPCADDVMDVWMVNKTYFMMQRAKFEEIFNAALIRDIASGCRRPEEAEVDSDASSTGSSEKSADSCSAADEMESADGRHVSNVTTVDKVSKRKPKAKDKLTRKKCKDYGKSGTDLKVDFALGNIRPSRNGSFISAPSSCHPHSSPSAAPSQQLTGSDAAARQAALYVAVRKDMVMGFVDNAMLDQNGGLRARSASGSSESSEDIIDVISVTPPAVQSESASPPLNSLRGLDAGNMAADSCNLPSKSTADVLKSHENFVAVPRDQYDTVFDSVVQMMLGSAGSDVTVRDMCSTNNLVEAEEDAASNRPRNDCSKFWKKKILQQFDGNTESSVKRRARKSLRKRK